MNFIYTESLVTREFYEELRSNWTITHKVVPYLRLLDYLLSGDLFDEETGLLMLPRELCMSMRHGTQPTNSFITKDFASKFSDHFFPLVLTPSKPKVKVTQIQSMDAPKWLVDAWDRVQRAPRCERNVGFVSGTEHDLGLRRRSRCTAALSHGVLPKHSTVQEVLDYMNGLDERHFDPILKNWQDAYELALAIPDQHARKHQLAILNRIKVDPQPFYKPVELTSRIYGDGASFLGLNTELRNVLTSDWVKIDLKQAQLHIVSNLWGVTDVHAYINATPSGFWVDVANTMQVCAVKAKPGIKRATYSLIYGSSRENILTKLEEYVARGEAERFWNHPVIRTLLSARSTRLKSLNLTGRIYDAFGNLMDLKTWKDSGNAYSKAMSVLSCQSQSYELPILHPVVEYAKSTQNRLHPLHVTAWLHDGIWLHCEDPILLRQDVAQVKDLAENTSERLLGVRIPLDVEMPKSQI